MASLNGFDANTVQPSTGFEPIPEGKYVAIIEDSSLKTTKAGTGTFLELVFQIVDGPFQGRKLWSRLNRKNPNPKAVEIGDAELSAICRAVGVMKPQDSDELHNRPILITVKCKLDERTNEIRNEIKGYAPTNGLAVQPAINSNGQQPALAAGPPRAPWLKG